MRGRGREGGTEGGTIGEMVIKVGSEERRR